MKPIFINFLHDLAIDTLSLSLTEIKAVPEIGKLVPLLICAFAKAIEKFLSIPITSPVDFISGPSIKSTPGNLAKGKTDSFTEICLGVENFSFLKLIFSPTITFVASFAIGIPVAFETNGTVRLALGFTSRMYISSSCMANWIFINPITFKAFASATV